MLELSERLERLLLFLGEARNELLFEDTEDGLLGGFPRVIEFCMLLLLLRGFVLRGFMLLLRGFVGATEVLFEERVEFFLEAGFLLSFIGFPTN